MASSARPDQPDPRAFPSVWPAFGALGVVVAMAIVSLAVDLVVAGNTARQTSHIMDNALRSIELAKDLRYQAHRLAEVLDDPAKIATIASEIGAETQAYVPLATEAGEREEFQHLQGLLVGLRDRHDISLIASIETSIARLIAINEASAGLGVDEIAATHDHMFAADVAAGTLTLASAIAVAVVLLRTLRRQRELMRDHLALVAERHGEIEAFAARASHDLKGPLSPLRGYADLLHDESPRAKDIGQRIRRAADRMNAIVDDLLALSVAGQPVPGRVVVASTILELVQELKSDLRDAEVVVEIDDCVVACSAGVLGQVARNILSNAIKYRAADRHLSVRIDGRRVGRLVELVFVDNGVGMDAETIAHAFEAFYRAPSASAPGHGLGLSIVRRALDALGGEVALRSVQGEGTRVTVKLPAA